MTVHPIDTEALRRLADAATEGPWYTFETKLGRRNGIGSKAIPEDEAVMEDEWAGKVDAEFIAAARTAVPALLDENAALRARIKAVGDVLEESEARGPVGMTFNGTPFPAWISIATVRRALDGDA